MTSWEESLAHAAAVRDAAAAVDAARAAHDAAAEAVAVLMLEAAGRARCAFLEKLNRRTSGDDENHDPARAPGRKFWDGNQ